MISTTATISAWHEPVVARPTPRAPTNLVHSGTGCSSSMTCEAWIKLWLGARRKYTQPRLPKVPRNVLAIRLTRMSSPRWQPIRAIEDGRYHPRTGVGFPMASGPPWLILALDVHRGQGMGTSRRNFKPMPGLPCPSCGGGPLRSTKDRGWWILDALFMPRLKNWWRSPVLARPRFGAETAENSFRIRTSATKIEPRDARSKKCRIRICPRTRPPRLPPGALKADLERELETWSLNCTKCGLDVHWVGGLGITPGHWSHAEPAPHGEPAVLTTIRIGRLGYDRSRCVSARRHPLPGGRWKCSRSSPACPSGRGLPRLRTTTPSCGRRHRSRGLGLGVGPVGPTRQGLRELPDGG
jgi:hypothetical protein